jgi:hypothetical protein
MEKTKYSKYLAEDFVIDGFPMRDPKTGEMTKNPKAIKRLAFDGSTHWGGINYWMRMTYVTQPFKMEQVPHTHDYDQCAHFYGGDPSKLDDFQAEVWFYLGDEVEKQVITKPTIIYIPKGLKHCPLTFVKIDKPIIFQNVCFTGEYVKTLEDGKQFHVRAKDGV